MDLILELEAKFNKINNQIDSNSKVELINNNYNNDIEAINRVFDSTKEKKYENGLNECRGEMLRQLIVKRDEKLGEVNELVQNMGENHRKNLNKLRRLADLKETSYISFSRSLISVFESVLSRSKLMNGFNLYKLFQYFPFMRNEEEISLANVKHLLDTDPLNFYHFYNIHILPFNRVLLTSDIRNDMYDFDETYLIIINKRGDLLSKLKTFEFCSVSLNASHIFAYQSDISTLSIYDFNLELVHSVKLETSNGYYFLSNYDFTFYDEEQSTIAFFNVKTTQLKRQVVKLDKREFITFCGMSDQFDFKDALEKSIADDDSEDSFEDYSEPDFKLDLSDFCLALEDINENFLFLEGYLIPLKFSIIFIVNRNDNNNLFHYFVCDMNQGFMSVYNSNIFIEFINCTPLNSVKCEIHDTSTLSTKKDIVCLYKESVFDEKQLGLYNFYSTASHKYIFKKEFPYKEIAKFRVY